MGERERQGGKEEDEPRQRAAHRYVEQRAPEINRRANPNEGAKGAGKDGGGQEVRQACVEPVIHASEKMSEFVGQQDDQKCQREWQPFEQSRRLPPSVDEGVPKFFDAERRQVGLEIPLHARSYDRGSEQRRQKQSDVQPISMRGLASRAGFEVGIALLHVTPIGGERGGRRRYKILRGHVRSASRITAGPVAPSPA